MFGENWKERNKFRKENEDLKEFGVTEEELDGLVEFQFGVPRRALILNFEQIFKVDAGRRLKCH